MLAELHEPLTEDLRSTLGGQLVALYLTGSAAEGDWDSDVSDIDLVAVVRPRAEQLDMVALDAVHRRFLERNPSWLNRLEIVYVASATLATGGRTNDLVAVINPGETFHVTGPASDWLQNWYLLREYGVALVGPPARDVIDEITGAEFAAAARSYIDYLAGQMLDQHSDGGLAYAVLSACRVNYTLDTGGHVSKEAAAAWQRARSPELERVLDGALIARRGGAPADRDAWRAKAADFVRASAAAARSQQQGNGRSDERVSAERDR